MTRRRREDAQTYVRRRELKQYVTAKMDTNWTLIKRHASKVREGIFVQ